MYFEKVLNTFYKFIYSPFTTYNTVAKKKTLCSFQSTFTTSNKNNSLQKILTLLVSKYGFFKRRGQGQVQELAGADHASEAE